jgi:hypothetical protein
MADVVLSFNFEGEEENERVRAALRGFDMPDASFLEEDESEGRDQPLLRFEEQIPIEKAAPRAGEITRAAGAVADVPHDRIASFEGGWGGRRRPFLRPTQRGDAERARAERR